MLFSEASASGSSATIWRIREMSAATFQNFDCSSVVDSSLRSLGEIKVLVMGFSFVCLTATIAAFMTQPLHGRSDDCPLRPNEVPEALQGLQSPKTNLCEDAELKDVWLWTGLKGKNVTGANDYFRRMINGVNIAELQAKTE